MLGAWKSGIMLVCAEDDDALELLRCVELWPHGNNPANVASKQLPRFGKEREEWCHCKCQGWSQLRLPELSCGVRGSQVTLPSNEHYLGKQSTQ